LNAFMERKRKKKREERGRRKGKKEEETLGLQSTGMTSIWKNERHLKNVNPRTILTWLLSFRIMCDACFVSILWVHELQLTEMRKFGEMR